jgi:hypothetical protein
MGLKPQRVDDSTVRKLFIDPGSDQKAVIYSWVEDNPGVLAASRCESPWNRLFFKSAVANSPIDDLVISLVQ